MKKGRKNNMAQKKKDGVRVNFYMNRELSEKLDDYAEEMGQTKTTALERILIAFFKEREKTEKSKD